MDFTRTWRKSHCRGLYNRRENDNAIAAQKAPILIEGEMRTGLEGRPILICKSLNSTLRTGISMISFCLDRSAFAWPGQPLPGPWRHPEAGFRLNTSSL
jgi:hypothetical protein